MTTATAEIRIVLADDEELFRRGLASLLGSRPHIRVVAQCGRSREALETARATRPDVMVLGQGTSGDSVEIAERVVESLDGTRVMLLARDGDKLLPALRAGVTGYILSSAGVEELLEAVDLVADGGVFVSRSLAGGLVKELLAASELQEEAKAPVGDCPLSQREREVARHVALGATNKEIAERLIMTENTAKVHVRNILEKLELPNKQALAAWAVEHGLTRTQATADTAAAT